MSTNPLNDIAPLPKTEEDVTAERIARHLTAQAFLTGDSTFKAGREALAPGAEPEKLRAYVNAITRLTDQFSTVFLLRALSEHAPDKVEEVALRLWECWQDGGVMPELLYDWLEAYGVDPDEFEKAAESEAA